MALKVLGRSNPAASTATTLYTVASGKSAVISTLAVCNQAGTAGTYRVYVVPTGDTLSADNYLVFDAPIDPNSSVFLTLGVTLASLDLIGIQGNSTSFSFMAFGDES